MLAYIQTVRAGDGYSDNKIRLRIWQLVLSDNFLSKFGNVLLQFFGVIAFDVEIVAREMGIDGKPTVFQPRGSDAFDDHPHQLRRPHRQRHPFIVSGNALLDCLMAISGGGNRLGFELVEG